MPGQQREHDGGLAIGVEIGPIHGYIDASAGSHVGNPVAQCRVDIDSLVGQQPICLVTRPRARARPWPIVLTAKEAVLMTPRVALVNDTMHLACRSPSNRPSRKRWTSPKQRVWFRLIVWPRESWLHTRRFAICRLGATNPRRARNTNPRSMILYFSESPSTLPDLLVTRSCRIFVFHHQSSVSER
jgi:hypothetical protein